MARPSTYYILHVYTIEQYCYGCSINVGLMSTCPTYKCNEYSHLQNKSYFYSFEENGNLLRDPVSGGDIRVLSYPKCITFGAGGGACGS